MSDPEAQAKMSEEGIEDEIPMSKTHFRVIGDGNPYRGEIVAIGLIECTRKKD